MKKLPTILLTAAGALALLLGCEGTSPEDTKPDITLSPESEALISEGISLEAGQDNLSVNFTATSQWTAEIRTTKAEEQWLDVSPKSGEAGQARVTVTASDNDSYERRSGTLVLSCDDVQKTISITQAGKVYVPVAGIEMSPQSISLKRGETAKLTATVEPSDASEAEITWESVNPEVVTVDQEGNIEAKSLGTAMVHAKCGDHMARCAVSVVQPATGIQISMSELTLEEEKSETLTVTIVPEDHTDSPEVVWGSTDAKVATVDGGKVTAVAEGTCEISASITVEEETFTAVCSVTVNVTKSLPAGAVDLGFSVYWASCNIGAEKPEDYGDYFAWGETETKENYTWGTYKWCNGSSYSLTKYNSSSGFGIVDNKITLEAEDDVAHVKLGGKWRMPTTPEVVALLNTRNYSSYLWEWKTINGHNGWLVTYHPNNSSIFFPAAGYQAPEGTAFGEGPTSYAQYVGTIGDYWTSNYDFDYFAYGLYFNFESKFVDKSPDGITRHFGVPVRPVWDPDME